MGHSTMHSPNNITRCNMHFHFFLFQLFVKLTLDTKQFACFRPWRIQNWNLKIQPHLQMQKFASKKMLGIFGVSRKLSILLLHHKIHKIHNITIFLSNVDSMINIIMGDNPSIWVVSPHKANLKVELLWWQSSSCGHCTCLSFCWICLNTSPRYIAH
jgi:hypothetical protein